MAKSLEEVPDDVFSKRMMGDGIAIATSDEYVKSPVSGEVVTVFPTGHAFIVKDKVSQADILVHIGVDTVNVASPEMFAVVKEAGEQVEAGDNMVKVNWELVREQAKSDLVIIVNASPDKVVSNKQEGKNITANAHVFEVR